MAENRRFFLINITILLLIVFSSCNAYQLYRDSIGMYDLLIEMKLFFRNIEQVQYVPLSIIY